MNVPEKQIDAIFWSQKMGVVKGVGCVQNFSVVYQWISRRGGGSVSHKGRSVGGGYKTLSTISAIGNPD